MKLGLESLRIERGRQAYGQTPGIAAEKTQGADAFSTALEKLEFEKELTVKTHKEDRVGTYASVYLGIVK